VDLDQALAAAQVFLADRPQLPQLLLFGGLLGTMALISQRRGRRGRARLRWDRPGPAARWRARRGTRHPKGAWAVGYRSALRTVSLSDRVLRLGGLLFGAPGSGKTKTLEGLVQAAARNGWGVVLVDPKGSATLRRTVAELGGLVWSIGGFLRWAPLESDPEVMAEQLLEGERDDPAAPRVFREGARLACQQLGRAMALAGEEPDIHRVTHLLRSGEWAAYVQAHLGPGAVPLTRHELDGVRTFAAGLSGLLLSPAGQSLGSGSDCLRIAEAMERGQVVLFSLDGSRYPETTRRLAGWAFLGLRTQLSTRQQRPRVRPCLVAIDEAHRVGWTGRLAVDLTATGREAGVPVVLASQGPSDLEEWGRHLLQRAVQDAAWIMCFRQGTLDSERASRMLGVRLAEERSWVGERESVRVVERPWAPASALEALHPGDAWLRIPAVDGRDVRAEPVRVALPQEHVRVLPRVLPLVVEVPAGPMLDSGDSELWTPRVVPMLPAGGGCGEGDTAGDTSGIPPAGLLSPLPMGGDRQSARFWGQVERLACGCWRWTGRQQHGYGRFKMGQTEWKAHRLAYTWLRGPIPPGHDLDHCCPCPHGRDTLCVNPWGHLQVLAKRRHGEVGFDRREAA
jgi:Type IV secretion-system coupling protein DNA-binding domain